MTLNELIEELKEFERKFPDAEVQFKIFTYTEHGKENGKVEFVDIFGDNKTVLIRLADSTRVNDLKAGRTV